MSTHLRHRLIKKRYRLFRYLFLACFYLAVAFLVSLQAAGCFEFIDSVGILPGEVGVFAAEVTVGCRLFVDGATQVLVIAAAVLIGNVLTDIAYSLLDPKIRESR